MNLEQKSKIYKMREQAKKQGNPILRDTSFELLSLISEVKKPLRILEIGTNVGLTAITMLLNSKRSVVDTIEIDEEKIKKAKKNCKAFGVLDRVRFFCGDASKIIPLIDCKYDLIFLDGPKGHYYEYLQYLIYCVKKGGIIFADNVLYKGYRKGLIPLPHRDRTIFNSMENYITTLNNDKNYNHFLVDIEDGISIAVKINE